MHRKILELAKKHGRDLSAEILQQNGIPLDNLRSVLRDIVADEEVHDLGGITFVYGKKLKVFDVEYVDSDGLTPIQIAVQKERWEQALSLLKEGIDYHSDGAATARAGYAILRAAKNNNHSFIEAARHHFCLYKDVTISASNHFTALHWAVKNNNVKMVEVLLDAMGVASRYSCDSLRTLAVVLRENNNPEILSLFSLSNYASILAEQVIFAAAQADDWEAVRIFMQKFTFDERDERYSKLLYWAAYHGKRAKAIEYAGKGGVFYYKNEVKNKNSFWPDDPTCEKSAIQAALENEHYEIIYLATQLTPAESLAKLELGQTLPDLIRDKEWEIAKKVIATKPTLYFDDRIAKNALCTLIDEDQIDLFRELLHLPAVFEINPDHRSLKNEEVGKKVLIARDCIRKESYSVVTHALERENAKALKVLHQDDVLVEFMNNMIRSFETRPTTASYWKQVRRLVELTGLRGEHLFSMRLLCSIVKVDDDETLVYLLNHDANIYSLETSTGLTLAEYAGHFRAWKCVLALATYPRADLKRLRLATAMTYAADEASCVGNWDVVKALLKLGVPGQYSNHKYLTAYFLISSYQHDLLRMLLSNPEYDVNIARRDSPSALEFAEAMGKVKAVQLLVEHGAKHFCDVLQKANAKKWDQIDALIAIHFPDQAHPETIKDIKQLYGRLIHLAVEQQNHEMFNMCIDKGADLAQPHPFEGITLLETMVRFKNSPFLREDLDIHRISSGINPAKIMFECKDNQSPFNAQMISRKISNGVSLLHQYFVANWKSNACQFGVLQSAEASIATLIKRYLNINIDAALNELQRFIAGLQGYDKKYADNANIDLHELEKDQKQLIALLWNAACDRHALPEDQPALYGSDAKPLEDFIYLRQLALIEAIINVDIRANRGFRPRLTQALHRAHPDVVICFNQAYQESDARDLAKTSFRRVAENLFASYSLAEQRRCAQSIRYTRENIAFYEKVSALFKSELIEIFRIMPENVGSYDEEISSLINSLADPASFGQFSLQPMSAFAALFEKINALEKELDSGNMKIQAVYKSLQDQAANAFDDTSERSLSDELSLLQQAYRSCVDMISARSLQHSSFLASSPRQQKDNNMLAEFTGTSLAK